MAKQNPRKSDFRLTFIQLVIVAGFCLGCMVASYWLGFYTGTRAGYETAVSTDLAASAKIPIDPPAAREERPASVSDVYARLDGTATMGAAPSPTPPQKGTQGPEIAAIPKVEVTPKTREEDLDAEIADTLIAPEDETDGRKPAAPSKSAVDGVWSAQGSTPGQAPEGDRGNTLGGVKKEEPELQKTALPPMPTVKPTVEKTRTPEKSAIQEIARPSATPTVQSMEKTYSPPVKDKAGLPRGWFAQVAAPKELKDAEAVASRLRKSGFPVVVEHAQVRGERYYRVLVGPESSSDTASRLLGQLKRETYLQGEPFIKMVK